MHYFIEHTSLPVQTSAQGFGPVPGSLTTKYNVTSKFQLAASAKAFACMAGTMIVQQSDVDATLVNVIIAPKEGLEVPFESVRYIVYRGLLKDSFFSGTAIKPSGTGSSELINRFWTEWNDTSSSLTPTQLVFGYDSSLGGTTDIDKVFDNTQNAKPIGVKEGEWIGNFTSSHEIGFEIVLFHNHFTMTLEGLRAGSYTVDVTGLSGFDEKTKREEILAFIDPPALFGLHYDIGVNASTYSGTTKSTVLKKGTTLYTDLIDVFDTSNRVYLDIRSEKGYSYNFYDNYKDISSNNIKIGNSDTIPVAAVYENSNWPIAVIDGPITTSSTENDVKLHVRIDDNLKPLLYFLDPKIRGSKNRKQVMLEDLIRDGALVEWSKELTFYFPNTGTGASRENIANYLKLHYFRQEYNAASPAKVLSNETYYDLAFCPILLPSLGDATFKPQEVKDPWPTLVRGTFPGSADTFSYVADTGVVWDADRLVFYTKTRLKVANSEEKISPVPSFAIKPGFDLAGTAAKGSLVHKQLSVLSNELDETGVGEVKALEVIHNSAEPGYKENIIVLGIAQSELQSLKDIVGLSDKHGKYITLEEISGSPLTDANGVSFRKFEVKLQGYDSTGARDTKSVATPLYVYTKDGLTFNSRSFGATEAIDNKTKLSEIYGGIKVYKWTGYVNDEREANVRGLIESVSAEIESRETENYTSLPILNPPSMLCTFAIGEGLNLWIEDHYDPNSPHHVMIDERIDGFMRLGVDHFSAEFFRYQPYLPADFNEGPTEEFKEVTHTNEWSQNVRSADFKDLESGLLGAAAVIMHRRDTFLADAYELEYATPTMDELVFWTYVYYQGEGRAKTYLRKNKGYDFTKKASSKMGAVRRLALERTATWWHIKISNLFSN